MGLEYYGFSVHTKTEEKDSKKYKSYELEYYEKKLKAMKEAEENTDSLFKNTNPIDDYFSNISNNLFNFSKTKLSYNFNSSTNISERLVERARVDAYNTNTTGWCYRSVAKVLADEGLAELHGESAHMAAGQLAENANFKKVKNQNDIKPGDVIVIGNGGPGDPNSELNIHGHIMIVGENGVGYSDHAQQIDLNKYKGREINIYRAKSV